MTTKIPDSMLQNPGGGGGGSGGVQAGDFSGTMTGPVGTGAL